MLPLPEPLQVFENLPIEDLQLDNELVPFPSNDTCQVCDGEGNIMICDGCPKTFHKSCTGMEPKSRREKDSDEWFCRQCRGDRQRQTIHMVSCVECLNQVHLNSTSGQQAEVLPIQCSLCEDYMHFDCLKVPLELLLHCAVTSSGSANSCGWTMFESCRQVVMSCVDF